MSYKEYEGLTVEAAVAKIKAKAIHDEEDIAFARARVDYFTPEEFEAIVGDKKPEGTEPTNDDANAKTTANEGTQPAGNDANANASTGTANATEEILTKDSMKADEFQALAASLELDTSGTKAELAERINAHRKEVAEKAAAAAQA